jgi:hypothetical protein
MNLGESGTRRGKGDGMGNDKDIVRESWDIEGDVNTVQQKWAEFTTALKFAPSPSGPLGLWFTWDQPETDAEEGSVVFEEIGPDTTRVKVTVVYDDSALVEEGETFQHVARRLDTDMLLFKEYAEGRLPKEWPRVS